MSAKPWFRKQDGFWYVYLRINGNRRQVKLAEGKESRETAYARWHELASSAEKISQFASTAIAGVLDEFLDWCQKNRAQGTYDIYRNHIESFCRHAGPATLVEQLKPKHVTAWLDACDWSDSTKAGAAQTIRTAFGWLQREGHIEQNPVAGARGPSKRPREKIFTEGQFQALLNESQPDFRQLLEFMRHTGCRPQEATSVEARHVDLAQRRIVFPPSEAKGKRHPRVIYLDDRALEIVAKLMAKEPTGKVFCNDRGNPWNRNMVRCRFRRVRDKIGGNFCAYHIRHTFATDALQRLEPITVATLMGHSDASTLAKNYQHLAKLPSYMIDAARKATGGDV